MERLSKADLQRAFELLSQELERCHSKAELLLVGGAAMVVLFGARESTKDVDAITIAVEGGANVADAANAVASALGLPNGWLNDAAKGYLQGIAAGSTVFSSTSLTIKAAAVHQLLAMKLSAWRDDVDVQDARLLLSQLPGQRDQIWQLVTPFLVVGRELKARYAFDDLWDELHGTS